MGRALAEITESLHELRPVRAEHGFINRTAGRFTEESDGVRTDGLDRLCTTINFFNVYAWRKVARCHRRVLLLGIFRFPLVALCFSFDELLPRWSFRGRH